ncbi:hypothetical protein C8F04DRAFT_1172851 [Mycena alexandri]|uniref:Uncharacterized protein n=1 Tax=Mycena alexandri TaxID=1745969 RepID=A0AAD6TJA3_9AGAR|nr:hypothetical protein C8F04DRAFT_1172851 [Mycena alexandri]
MNVRDLITVGRSCKFFHKEANAKIEREMVAFFKLRDLKWDEIRFMLAHTDSFITGLSATQAAFMSDYRGYGEAKKLDIFAPDNKCKDISQLIEVATAYSKGITRVCPSDRISKTVEFKHADRNKYPFTIAVHACHTEIPRVTMFRQKHTALFVSIGPEGFWIADVAHTLRGITFAHPTYMPLGGKAGIDDLCRLARDLDPYGLTFTMFHRLPDGTNECGKDIACPSTIRTSEDSNAFFGAFHCRPLGLKPARRSHSTGTVWALGAAGCDTRPGMGFFVRTFELGAGAKGERAMAAIQKSSSFGTDFVWEARYSNVVMK